LNQFNFFLLEPVSAAADMSPTISRGGFIPRYMFFLEKSM
jgi:hypothetical protein